MALRVPSFSLANCLWFAFCCLLFLLSCISSSTAIEVNCTYTPIVLMHGSYVWPSCFSFGACLTFMCSSPPNFRKWLQHRKSGAHQVDDRRKVAWNIRPSCGGWKWSPQLSVHPYARAGLQQKLLSHSLCKMNWNSLSPPLQLEDLCDKLKADPMLSEGFNLMGFSQVHITFLCGFWELQWRMS